MIITAHKTPRIVPESHTLTAILDAAIAKLPERSIVAITSKIVSLCEGRVAPIAGTDKQKLVEREAELYLPESLNRYGIPLSITGSTLIPAAGIDESNAGDTYVLWPADAQQTADAVREYLRQRFRLKEVGVVITDSMVMPLRWGTTGIALAHSGFMALNDYRGTPDLFGRPLGVSQTNVSGGLAAAAVLAMGEGAEQTPIATITDVSFVQFQPRNPSPEELSALRIDPSDDLYAPLLEAVKWLEGGKSQKL